MEKIIIESSIEESTTVEDTTKNTLKVISESDIFSKRIKPRAIIFKATNSDLFKIQELIKTQFPEVEIIYVTTGPNAGILHVTKSVPFENQNFSAHSLYTIE